MTEATIWVNKAHILYDHEQDVVFLVRTPNVNHQPGEEWRIINTLPHKRLNKEEAIALATEYSEEHPGVPVRVEAHTFYPYLKGHAVSQVKNYMNRQIDPDSE